MKTERNSVEIPEYVIHILTTLDEIETIRPQWKDLQERCEIDIPFNTYEWYYSWWLKFTPAQDFEVFVIYKTDKSQQLVAIVPTYKFTETRTNKTVLNLWVNTHSFRTGILCDTSHYQALDLLMAHFGNDLSWDIFQVPYLVAKNSAESAFKHAISGQELPHLVQPGMESPILKIDGIWDDYFKKFGRSTRETFRRKTRKLLDKLDGTVEIFHGPFPELDKKLNDCWRISKKTWKHRAGSSIASDPQRIKFYEEIANEENGWIVLALLYLHDEPVAFEYNILYKGTLYNLKLGYDENIRKLSPGIVLRLKMLEWAFNNIEVKYFDFMGNAAEYKTMFSTYKLPHENIVIYHKTIVNLLLVYYKSVLRPLFAQYLRPIKRMLKKIL
jgi:hypothetical protein